MKLIVIFSTDSLEGKTIRRQSKKINLNNRRQMLSSRKVKVHTHSQRSCNPDTIKLHQMRDTQRANSLLAMIDLKAKIYPLNRIVKLGRLNAKEPPKLANNKRIQLNRSQWVKVSKEDNLKKNQQTKAKTHMHLRLQH